MNADSFWKVIGNYNQSTLFVQVILGICLILAYVVARKDKLRWLPKVVYGSICIFLAIVFFLIFGTEPIQLYFAFPLFLLLGLVFIFEAVRNKREEFQKFTKIIIKFHIR